MVSALEANGVTKSEDKVLFKSCFQRLYLLSYSFIKVSYWLYIDILNNTIWQFF